ncbi:MAG: lytic transglycosylase domain-containing protein [Actinomycetota bacterium]|nr:lytic transglycosylase domain-containing protein [Actinomycetota bacterium]
MFAVLVLLAACAGEPEGRGPAFPEAAPASTGTSAATTTAAAEAAAAVSDRAPVAAGDPEGLADQLAAAASTIADPSAPPTDTDAAGHLQQVAVRQLVVHPEWDAAVALLLPEGLRASVAQDVGAGRELAALVRRPGSTLPAWRIEAPPPAEVLRRHYEEGEASTGVPWEYLAAIHLVETRMSRIDGRSSAGARGPMQFLPSTWATYGRGDIDNDRDAILAAARFLAAHGAPADLPGALHRYNPTPRYVRSVRAYAGRMRADGRAFLGYHGWEVHYLTSLGDVWLRVGYDASAPRPVTAADVAG